MSGECEKCHEHTLECQCTRKILENTYWKPSKECKKGLISFFQQAYSCHEWFQNELPKRKKGHLEYLIKKRESSDECKEFYESYRKEFGDDYLQKEDEVLMELDRKDIERRLKEYCSDMEYLNLKCECYRRHLTEKNEYS